LRGARSTPIYLICLVAALRAPCPRAARYDFFTSSRVFPNASCVGTLIDRLLHRAEILALEGKSYRLKEAEERAALKAKARSAAARKKR